MDPVTENMKIESLHSFGSAIRKTDKALLGMTGKAANTALIRKRLDALKVGLAVLENAWHNKPHSYSPAQLAAAGEVLRGLLPSIEKLCAKAKTGSPQRTLLDRRATSLKLAVQAIDEAAGSPSALRVNEKEKA